jgi:hypothetical protein
MVEESSPEARESRQLAARFFNETWNYLEKPDRSPEDDLLMIHLAHASRWHWQLAGDASNWAIGEWQISRVYAALGRAEPALFHARACLRISDENRVRPFLLGCAHEAIARALAIGGDESAGHHLATARALAQTVADSKEKEILESDLATIPLAAV